MTNYKVIFVIERWYGEVHEAQLILMKNIYEKIYNKHLINNYNSVNVFEDNALILRRQSESMFS